MQLHLHCCTICYSCSTFVAKDRIVLNNLELPSSVSLLYALRLIQYNCNWNAYCTAQIKVPVCSDTVVGSMASTMYMQLSCMLSSNFCRTIVVEQCFVLQFMQYECCATGNVLRVTELCCRLIMFRVSKPPFTHLWCLDVRIILHIFGHFSFTELIFQKVVSNESITTTFNRIATYTALYDENVQYIS